MERYVGAEAWEVVDDPDYVEYIAVIREKNGTGKSRDVHIGVHKCTESDYAKF